MRRVVLTSQLGKPLRTNDTNRLETRENASPMSLTVSMFLGRQQQDLQIALSAFTLCHSQSFHSILEFSSVRN